MIFGQTLVAFVLALALLVFFHELGHYLAARWCGVKVLRFSVGFGPTILSRRFGRDRTEWALAAIPLGGYVRMLDERETPSADIPPSDLPRAFGRQPVWKRSVIVAAGPAANLLLAIVLYAVLALSGVTEPAAVVDAPRAASPAAAAGLAAGDRVVAVDGDSVKSWNELRLSMLEAMIERRPASLTVERDGATRTLVMPAQTLPAEELERDFLRTLGVEPAAASVEVAQVVAGSAAERAGLLPGDRVLAVDGEPIRRADGLIERVRERVGQPIALAVARGDARLDIQVVPESKPSDRAGEKGRSVGRIGAALANRVETVTVAAGPIESVVRGAEQTWRMSVFSLRMLGKMLVGDLSWRNLSGPVTIADYAGQSARIGWQAYVGFLALISVSLGVLNLLPVPVLDGGHLVYFGLEAVLRRPLPERFVEFTQRAGLGIVMAMMVLALFNDITRLFGT